MDHPTDKSARQALFLAYLLSGRRDIPFEAFRVGPTPSRVPTWRDDDDEREPIE